MSWYLLEGECLHRSTTRCKLFLLVIDRTLRRPVELFVTIFNIVHSSRQCHRESPVTLTQVLLALIIVVLGANAANNAIVAPITEFESIRCCLRIAV